MEYNTKTVINIPNQHLNNNTIEVNDFLTNITHNIIKY